MAITHDAALKHLLADLAVAEAELLKAETILHMRQEQTNYLRRALAAAPPEASPPTPQEAAAVLGRARAAKLSPERRQEIARKAAQARWRSGETHVQL